VQVKQSLANEILFGKLADGGSVSVEVKNDSLSLDIGKQKILADA
jgi:ATP-dependent Clp protease ATP-binding subunit ClpA